MYPGPPFGYPRFNGATSSSRWKEVLRENAGLSRKLASMGPPRRRGGRSSAVQRRGAGPSRFNGATSSSRWKVASTSR